MSSAAVGQERLRLVENDVKAGLIFSFLLYTRWPGSEDAPIRVCIWNRDTLDGRLAPISRRTAVQRPIELRVVSRIPDLAICSLVYVGADEIDAWPALRASFAGHGILTVSDSTGFARTGGMIEIYSARQRIGVRINRTAIASAGLSVEDRLLRLADISSGEAP